jgi:3,4-dihydroxy 2-butanone 4-phosphate synthase/GTP cyclohydrolase II
VVLHDWRAQSLLDMVTGRHASANQERMLREYGIGAQILADLGMHEIELLSNSDRHIVGLQGYGLNVVGRRGLDVPA